jgi:hypothetical protein
MEVKMRINRESQIQKHLKNMRQNLEKLESLISESSNHVENSGPQSPRIELLEQIYVLGVVDQHKLFNLLDQRRIPHTWIGAQSRAGYLEMWGSAAGTIFYRVTQKAITEQSLGRIILLTEFANSAQNALENDWNSQEDSIYDRG